MNEELDSQLSAMFDDELPAVECELLARRLSRDDVLKARWSRYAVIGAVIRSERGVVLQSAVAGRVNEAISREPVLAASAQAWRARMAGWTRLAAGAGVAAGVAALSILWLRLQTFGAGQPVQMTLASASAPAGERTVSNASDSFVVPPPSSAPAMMAVPPTQLADYVVAHSAYSWPISRGSLLSALMAGQPETRSSSAASGRQASGRRAHAALQTR
jgi:hypothetical protein